MNHILTCMQTSELVYTTQSTAVGCGIPIKNCMFIELVCTISNVVLYFMDKRRDSVKQLNGLHFNYHSALLNIHQGAT